LLLAAFVFVTIKERRLESLLMHTNSSFFLCPTMEYIQAKTNWGILIHFRSLRRRRAAAAAALLLALEGLPFLELLMARVKHTTGMARHTTKIIFPRNSCPFFPGTAASFSRKWWVGGAGGDIIELI
jgi:hypothetical protein